MAHLYNEIQWRLFCCVLLFFNAIYFGLGYANMHAELDGRWVLNVVRHYVYDIIETTEAGPYMQYIHTHTHLQSGANTFVFFKRKKSISINITYFNGLQVAIDREWVWKQELQQCKALLRAETERGIVCVGLSSKKKRKIS